MSNYYIERAFVYNQFGADEHIAIRLYRQVPNSDKLKFVDSWYYSTFMNQKLSRARADRKIRSLRETYDAKML